MKVAIVPNGIRYLGINLTKEGTRVHPWRIHVDVWQNPYNIVK